MPNGQRIRANNVYGIISDNPLTSGAATFNSISLPLLPTVSSAHAVVVLDPKRVHGDPEIIVVTAHTAMSTVATIIRGQYGTSPREHPVNTVWAHVPIDEDFVEIVTSANRPSDPYRGQLVFEYDTDRYIGRSISDAWQALGFFFDPPHVELWSSVTQLHSNNANWQALIFNTEDAKTVSTMHDTATNTSRVTVPREGVYLVAGGCEIAANATGRRGIGIRVNGTGIAVPNKGFTVEQTDNLTVSGLTQQISKSIKLAANDYVELVVYQSSGGNLNINTNPERNPYFSVTYIGRGR